MNKVEVEIDAVAGVSRRQFLKTSSGVLMGTIAASSGLLATLAPSQAWALSLKSLNESEASAILKVTRAIFPHDTLDDAVYALVVKDLDANTEWASLDYLQRENLVIKMAGTDFFEKVRGTSVVSLYNNEMAWAHFGYEGSSYELGGYFDRGFQDLDWLPNPPADASPAKS
jgi:hypothetical protein